MSRDAVLHHLVEAIAEGGMSGLSVRNVASRAGVAIGTVQHHFPTKAAMLLAAMDSIGVDAVQAHDDATQDATAETRLLATVRLLVPSGPESRVSRVWLAFAAYAPTDAAVRARYEELWARTVRGLERLFAASAPAASSAAVEDAATELLALLDGLAVAVLAEPHRMPADRARGIAERRCRELLVTLRG
jgi:AcrR family transcriptional regulator